MNVSGQDTSRHVSKIILARESRCVKKKCHVKNL
jgi:hypothetical protein